MAGSAVNLSSLTFHHSYNQTNQTNQTDQIDPTNPTNSMNGFNEPNGPNNPNDLNEFTHLPINAFTPERRWAGNIRLQLRMDFV